MKKISVLLLFSLLCFGVGFFGYPYIVPFFAQSWVKDRIYKKNLPPLVQVDSVKNHIETDPQVDPKIQESLDIKKIIDTQLKPPSAKEHREDPNSTYKKTRDIIVKSYNSGERDKKTIQSFLYLASLENNQNDYKKAADDWCKKQPEECHQSKMPIVINGQVKDEKGLPIVDAEISLSGEKSTLVRTDIKGNYTLSFETLNPRRMRILVHHPEFAGGSYTFVTLDPQLSADPDKQIFQKNFTLVRAVQKVTIDTRQKKIISGDAQVTSEGYVIENSFSKYLIPFNSIRTSDKKMYTGEVLISVFEFNRATANEFLQSDVFSSVYSFASEGLQTYSMPLIFFYDTKGKRLEVFKEYPMTVWTTNRELQNLVLENAQGKHQPGFNPNEYEEKASVENVARYIKEDEEKAYNVSQKNLNEYPITLEWTYQNESRLPVFFVYDQSTGLWETTGYSLVSPSTDTKHSIRARFWTKI